MRWKFALLLTLAGVLALGLVSVVAALPGAVPGLDFVRRAADERREENTEAVVLVNGRAITAAELAEMEQWVNANLSWMREAEKEATDPTQVALLRRTRELIERSGPRTVALAALIRDRALESAAIARGVWPDEATITERVARDRELAEQMKDPRLDAYVTTLGPAVYWERFYPGVVARELAEERLFEAVTGDELDLAVRQKRWLTFEREQVRSASIEVTDSEALGATSLEAAFAYLEQYWSLHSTQ
ncbi:MAG: hypothetical protein ACK42I_07315 [Thermomicrobium sp.]